MTAYSQPYRDPTDVVGRRIGAYLIDFLLIGALSAALIVPMFLSTAITAPSGTVECNTDSGSGLNDSSTFQSDTFSNDPNGLSLCIDDGTEVHYIPKGDENGFVSKVYAIAIGLQALNLVVLQGLVGASLGKLVLGLRVVRADGRTAGLGWAALRWILLFVDSVCCFLPGAILVFTTKGHRRIGDMAAGTFVVRRDAVDGPLVVPGVTTPMAAPMPGSWPAGPPAGGPLGGPMTGGTATPWAPPPAGPLAGPTTAPGADGPTWDPARNAYIQYDRDQAAWVEWDDHAKTWKPISQ